MELSFCSHSAVSAGDLRSSGTKSRSCLPLAVRKISCPFFSMRKVLNSLSIMSALVATVPSPPASPIVLIRFLFSPAIYLAGFSIADSRVPSLNGLGGLVSPVVWETEVTFKISPLFSEGSFCSPISLSSSS